MVVDGVRAGAGQPSTPTPTRPQPDCDPDPRLPLISFGCSKASLTGSHQSIFTPHAMMKKQNTQRMIGPAAPRKRTMPKNSISTLS